MLSEHGFLNLYDAKLGLIKKAKHISTCSENVIHQSCLYATHEILAKTTDCSIATLRQGRPRKFLLNRVPAILNLAPRYRHSHPSLNQDNTMSTCHTLQHSNYITGLHSQTSAPLNRFAALIGYQGRRNRGVRGIK